MIEPSPEQLLESRGETLYLRDQNDFKFWQFWVANSKLNVRWGKVGMPGTEREEGLLEGERGVNLPQCRIADALEMLRGKWDAGFRPIYADERTRLVLRYPCSEDTAVADVKRWHRAYEDACRELRPLGLGPIRLGDARRAVLEIEWFVVDELLAISAATPLLEAGKLGSHVTLAKGPSDADRFELHVVWPTYGVESLVEIEMTLPYVFRVNREEDYVTHNIGTWSCGNQFMGFVAARVDFVVPKGDSWRDHKRWYAILYSFDAEGHHLRTDTWCAGTTADGESAVWDRAYRRLAQWISRRDGAKPSDVYVRLFETTIDGGVFGLVDESNEDGLHVELYPVGIGFYPPWDGDYST